MPFVVDVIRSLQWYLGGRKNALLGEPLRMRTKNHSEQKAQRHFVLNLRALGLAAQVSHASKRRPPLSKQQKDQMNMKLHGTVRLSYLFVQWLRVSSLIASCLIQQKLVKVSVLVRSWLIWLQLKTCCIEFRNIRNRRHPDILWCRFIT